MKDNPKKVKLFNDVSNGTAAKATKPRFEKVVKARTRNDDTYESYELKKKQMERKFQRMRRKILMEIRSLLIEKNRLSLALKILKEDVKNNNANSQEE